MRRVPARLHVLLAPKVRLGVVLRRGPSRQVASIGWDLRTDEFTLGQWLNGRIYERRSDLSPDGRRLIYFAMNGRWQDPTGGSWTAISRAPYLKADVLLGKGDCWHGGGLFTGPRTYWLNDGYGHRPMRASGEVRRDEDYRPAGSYGGECPHVYYNRLQRDGWTFREPETVFDKPLRHGWTLRKYAHAGPPGVGHGCYWDEHRLIAPDGTGTALLPACSWAEVDGDDIVYAAEGALYRVRLRAGGPQEARLLHDFTPMRFKAVAAPY
ncbi:hypothetical protein Val02_34020 [Virgisporangium aliadipatigenens]|uniref:Uncharacterized protein n=1 Tax=Virgisporangium aliadipatigenens TaxID=741659 RepID=A0A8J3YJW8_9ACTN|nr:hypothetical protein [Virgisporangium aliadipatigenens]GIJ46516.1 hypothetical protein Val02_34020 [Virgisporangium aliadipatigenens]